jgi:hypothetical protein
MSRVNLDLGPGEIGQWQAWLPTYQSPTRTRDDFVVHPTTGTIGSWEDVPDPANLLESQLRVSDRFATSVDEQDVRFDLEGDDLRLPRATMIVVVGISAGAVATAPGRFVFAHLTSSCFFAERFESLPTLGEPFRRFQYGLEHEGQTTTILRRGIQRCPQRAHRRCVTRTFIASASLQRTSQVANA